MNRIGIAAAILAVLLIVAALLVTRPSRFHPSRLPPAPEVAASSVSLQPSTLTIPVNIPLSAVRTALEEAAPRRLCGGESGFMSTSWCFNREDLDVSGRDGAVVVSAGVNGFVNPPLVRQINVSGTAEMSARVAFGPEWRVVPATTASVDVAEATLRPLLEQTISVRGVIAPLLQEAVAGQGRRLREQIAADDSFERLARDAWGSLCRSVPLESGGDPSLHMRPVRAAAAPGHVEGDYLRLQFGVEVETRIGPPEGELECAFPDELRTDGRRPGALAINMPTEVSYEVVRAGLEDFLTENFGTDDDPRIHGVELRPYGSALLATVRLSVPLPFLLGGRREGTLYVLARPQLNAERQTVTLASIELDTESKHPVVAGMGEFLERGLRDELAYSAEFDLTGLDLAGSDEYGEFASMLDGWRATAESALRQRMGRPVDITATTDSATVSGITLAPESVLLTATAHGGLSVTLGSR